MSRYYDGNGNIVDTIKGANGKHRAPTVADVRKLQGTDKALYPSVTTILKVIANDWIVNWKVKEVLKKAFTFAKSIDSEQAFVDAVMKDFNDESDKTMDDGKDIHKAIENYLGGEEYDETYGKHVKNFAHLMEGCRGKIHSEVPLCYKETFNSGYGGTIDIVVDPTGFPLGKDQHGRVIVEQAAVVIDIKTVSKHPDKPHDSWILQTSAYAQALFSHLGNLCIQGTNHASLLDGNFVMEKTEGAVGETRVITAVITIERESGTAKWHDIKAEDMKWGVLTFNAALELWQRKNNLE